jgi:hypothetical protein
MPGPDDVVSAALGHLDNRVPGDRADAASFGDDPGLGNIRQSAVQPARSAETVIALMVKAAV